MTEDQKTAGRKAQRESITSRIQNYYEEHPGTVAGALLVFAVLMFGLGALVVG